MYKTRPQIIAESIRAIAKLTQETQFSLTYHLFQLQNSIGNMEFRELAPTSEYRELSDLISQILENTTYSRNQVVYRLREDFHNLSQIHKKDLLSAFIELRRRLVLFIGVDRILARLAEIPVSEKEETIPEKDIIRSKIGFEITCLYVHLAADAMDHNYYDVQQSRGDKKFLFDITTNKHLHEIFYTLGLHYLTKEFSKLAEEDKKTLYLDWHCEVEGYDVLLKKRDNCIKAAIAEIQFVLGEKLSLEFIVGLRTELTKATSKTALHEKLYLLENEIANIEINLPEDLSRVTAKAYLTSNHLMHKLSKLDDVYSILKIRYDNFVSLDKLLHRVLNITDEYSGPRDLKPVRDAVNLAYLEYSATFGLYDPAVKKLTSELSAFRKTTFTDHKAEGYASCMGFFQPSSRLVHILDYILQIAEPVVPVEALVKKAHR